MSRSITGVVLLTLLVTSLLTLTPPEACDMCQMSLRTVYGHFGGKVPSRRKLLHQLKHECKRHFNYRRRCLLLMKQNYDVIFREMTNGSFIPIETCVILKECKQHNIHDRVDFADLYEKLRAFALVGSTIDIYNSSE